MSNTNTTNFSHCDEIIACDWERVHKDYDPEATLNAINKIYAIDCNGKRGVLFTDNVSMEWCNGNKKEWNKRFNQASDMWTPEFITVYEDEAGEKFLSKEQLFKKQFDNHELGAFYTRQYVRFDTMVADGYCGGSIYEHLGVYYMEMYRERVNMAGSWRRQVINQFATHKRKDQPRHTFQ